MPVQSFGFPLKCPANFELPLKCPAELRISVGMLLRLGLYALRVSAGLPGHDNGHHSRFVGKATLTEI
ncbi:hypothetical protein J25TS5_45670 [Paenibacillus faecis]|nr:hypothetical protein J25TS5_45670 [Paenibacillus faecis]